ncbi:DNA-3-methyladenine glycosylase [Caulobacter hibisci]|uniref:DNA-3-methyladenine glycosylase n=1 Tax=Caulobacter hibisci TaxID=2035993 RepID=UPI001E4816A1|nr:DNA-3-methyladenine glycosylase [Caulobacter hibisci]
MIDLFDRPVEEVARALIGASLFFEGVGGIIVETEAYDADDPASHSFAGPTSRNAPMFGPPGRAYVYRSYGLHWCLNLVCGRRPGAAVLFRALEPTAGVEVMIARRGLMDPRRLAAGPGRLCQALGVGREQNQMVMTQPPFHLAPAAARRRCRRRPAHRHHQGGRQALAIWLAGFALSQSWLSPSDHVSTRDSRSHGRRMMEQSAVAGPSSRPIACRGPLCTNTLAARPDRKTSSTWTR